MSAGKSIPVCFAQNTTINLQSVTAGLVGSPTFDVDAYRPDLTKNWTLAICHIVDPYLFAIYNVGYTSKTGVPRNVQFAITNTDPLAARTVQNDDSAANPMLLNFKGYRAVAASQTVTLDASGLTNEGMVRAVKMTTNWTSQGRLRQGTPAALEQGGLSGLWELDNFNGRLFNGGPADLVSGNLNFDANVSSQPQFTQRQANQGSYQVLYPVDINNAITPIVATVSNSPMYTGSFDLNSNPQSISPVNDAAHYPFPQTASQRGYGTWGCAGNKFEVGLQSFTNIDAGAALNVKHIRAFELFIAPGGLFRSMQKQRTVVIDDSLIKASYKWMQNQPSDYPASFNDFNSTLKSFKDFIRPIATVGGPLLSMLEPEFAPVSAAINAWVQPDTINDPKRNGAVQGRAPTVLQNTQPQTAGMPGLSGQMRKMAIGSRIPVRTTTAALPTVRRPVKAGDNKHQVSCRSCGMTVNATNLPKHQTKCRGRRAIVPR